MSRRFGLLPLLFGLIAIVGLITAAPSMAGQKVTFYAGRRPHK